MSRSRYAWTMPVALVVVRKLETMLAPLGWHVAMTGGCLYRGRSSKDLDIVIFPHTADRHLGPTFADARVARLFRELGWTRVRTAEQLQRHWRSKGSTDTKHVEVWRDKEERRVDVMWLQ